MRKQRIKTFAIPPPTRLTIYRLQDKFKQTGSTHNPLRSGHFITLTTQENEFKVAQAFTQSPLKSKHRAFSELGIESRL